MRALHTKNLSKYCRHKYDQSISQILSGFLLFNAINTHLSRRCSCCLDGRPPSFLGQKALLCFSHTRLGRFFPALDMTAAAFVAFVAVVAAAEVGGSAVAAVAVGRPWPAALAK